MALDFKLLGVACLLLMTGCAVPDARSVEPASAASAETSARLPLGEVRHIGNAGLMIVQGNTKILFDPLYRNGYNNYHLVPEDVKRAVISGAAPYDAIDAVLISHAHGDHFDAADLIVFHIAQPDALIIAPVQAIEAMEATGEVPQTMQARFVPMGLDYGQDPLKIAFENLQVEAVRIPHAGGPARRALENLVYRVTLEGAATVIHMGDADPALEHFVPYSEHWQADMTDTAFPPYWFFLSAEGIEIVDDVLNAEHAVGVHVPVREPGELATSGRAYFGAPGEVRGLAGD